MLYEIYIARQKIWMCIMVDDGFYLEQSAFNLEQKTHDHMPGA